MHLFFCIWLFTQLSTQLFARLSAKLSVWLSDASQSDSLSSFIKISDGDLQCEFIRTYLTFHTNIGHDSPTFSFMARDHWPHLESPIFTIIKKDPHLSIILRRRSFINHVDTVFGGYFLPTIFCKLGIYKSSLILLSQLCRQIGNTWFKKDPYI